MKKTSFVLLLAAPAILAGCKSEKMTFEQARDAAVSQVLYNELAVQGISGDFELVTSSIVEDYKFKVTYTAGELQEYKGADGTDYHFITVSEAGDMALVTPPNYLDENLKPDFKYAKCYIEATFTCEGHESEAVKKKYNVKINTVSSCELAKIYDLGANIAVESYGVYTGTYKESDPYSGVWVADGDAGIMLYGVSALPEGLQKGDLVKFTGKTSPYNGLMELASPTIAKVTDGKDHGVKPAVTWEWSKDNAEFVEHNQSLEVKAAGTISDLKITDGKITFYVNDGDAKLYIYGYQKYMDADRYAAFKAVADTCADGDNVSVEGFLSYYGSGDFESKNMQVVNIAMAKVA